MTPPSARLWNPGTVLANQAQLGLDADLTQGAACAANGRDKKGERERSEGVAPSCKTAFEAQSKHLPGITLGASLSLSVCASFLFVFRVLLRRIFSGHLLALADAVLRDLNR